MHDDCHRKWRHVDRFIKSGDLKTLEDDDSGNNVAEEDDPLAEVT
jgi:hypothetical protein